MAVPLRDSFLRDTLTRAVDNDMESFQVVIENVNRYVEIVHHSHYSSDLLQCMSILGMIEYFLLTLRSCWTHPHNHSSQDRRLACGLFRPKPPHSLGEHIDPA